MLQNGAVGAVVAGVPTAGLAAPFGLVAGAASTAAGHGAKALWKGALTTIVGYRGGLKQFESLRGNGPPSDSSLWTQKKDPREKKAENDANLSLLNDMIKFSDDA